MSSSFEIMEYLFLKGEASPKEITEFFKSVGVPYKDLRRRLLNLKKNALIRTNGENKRHVKYRLDKNAKKLLERIEEKTNVKSFVYKNPVAEYRGERLGRQLWYNGGLI